MGKIFVAFIVLANFCFQSQVSGQPFTLLKDINGGIPYNVIRPSNLTEKDGLLFFNIGSSPARGLWRSNGFAEGTIKIKALSDFEGIGSIVKVDHIMFFNIFNACSVFLARLHKKSILLSSSASVKSRCALSLFSIRNICFFST